MIRYCFISVACFVFFICSLNYSAVAENARGDDVCRYLITHSPEEDVIYQPGIDAEGNPVEPAELYSQNHITPPETIDFPLTLRLEEYLSTSDLSDKIELQSELKTISVNTITGKVTYGGQEITSSLRSYCQSRRHRIKSGSRHSDYKKSPKPGIKPQQPE